MSEAQVRVGRRCGEGEERAAGALPSGQVPGRRPLGRRVEAPPQQDGGQPLLLAQGGGEQVVELGQPQRPSTVGRVHASVFSRFSMPTTVNPYLGTSCKPSPVDLVRWSLLWRSTMHADDAAHRAGHTELPTAGTGTGSRNALPSDGQVGMFDSLQIAGRPRDAETEQVAESADVAAGGVDFVQDAVFPQGLGPQGRCRARGSYGRRAPAGARCVRLTSRCGLMQPGPATAGGGRARPPAGSERGAAKRNVSRSAIVSRPSTMSVQQDCSQLFAGSGRGRRTQRRRRVR